jgi:hypothetical protein
METNHSLLGWMLVLGLFVQCGLGVKCHIGQDLDSKQESVPDKRHGLVGKILLFFGYFTCFTGVVDMKDALSNDQWVSFSQIIGCLLVLAIVGFSGLEQMRGRSSRYSTTNMFTGGRSVSAKESHTVVTSFDEKDQSNSPGMYRPTWKAKGGDVIDVLPKKIESPQSPRINRYKKGGDQKAEGHRKPNSAKNDFLDEIENLRKNLNSSLASDGVNSGVGTNSPDNTSHFGDDLVCEDMGGSPVVYRKPVKKARDLNEIVPDLLLRRTTSASPKKRTELLSRVRDQEIIPLSKYRSSSSAALDSIENGSMPVKNHGKSMELLNEKSAIGRLHTTYKDKGSLGTINSIGKSTGSMNNIPKIVSKLYLCE